MAENTKIEWADDTWNVVTGCTRVSPGCNHCYMFGQWDRLHGMHVRGYERKDAKAVFHESRIHQPLEWKRPRKIFTCSMGDVFHSDIPFFANLRIATVMTMAKQHTFQVLTKRPGRMACFTNKYLPEFSCGTLTWPDNAWAGTSVESAFYLPRLDVLARVPANVRFVSCEPLLGPLDLRPWLGLDSEIVAHEAQLENPETAKALLALGRAAARKQWGIHWVIVGGESGPGARPMHPDWVRDIRDQCQEAGVPFFFKQWGEWISENDLADGHWRYRQTVVSPAGHPSPEASSPGDTIMCRVGKKAAGALLDGREWREMPDGSI